MKTTFRTSLLGLALAGFAAVGCSSTTTTDLDASTYVYPDTATGPTLYGLSDGTYCYDITAVSAVSDGCALGVAGLVGSAALPGTYTVSAGQFTLGTEGSLGTGLISQNMGTLSRDGNTSDPSAPGCTWHQKDTTYLTMVGQNQFYVTVTENQDSITAACGAPAATCTSTWTWDMQIGTKTPPACK